MKKRLISLFLAMTMVAGMVAGCGSKEKASDSSGGDDGVVER